MNLQKELEGMYRNTIRIALSTQAECGGNRSRFGGIPDVPEGFAWPDFITATFDDKQVRPRPLSFLAQIDCAQAAALDPDGLLPKSGLLSFFYEVDSQRWGFDPADRGCAQVFYFSDADALSPAHVPAALSADFQFPAIPLSLSPGRDLPDWQDFALCHPEADPDDDDYGEEAPLWSTKLLGWPDLIQNNITCQCELISRGYYLGNTWDKIPAEEVKDAECTSVGEWLLLFQLDTISHGDDFELMFGDSGRLYFYISRQDLHARRFDRVWTVLQCC